MVASLGSLARGHPSWGRDRQQRGRGRPPPAPRLKQALDTGQRPLQVCHTRRQQTRVHFGGGRRVALLPRGKTQLLQVAQEDGR